MAIPHDIQMRLIKKRLVGKEGKSRVEEIKKILAEIPKYNTGPYGKIRKWLRDEIDKSKIKSKIKHQDWIGVKRQGVRQFVLVGCPSVGKSSLIAELSGLQTKVAAYEFTTLKPIPAVINLNGAYIQIVDLPGLLEGATKDIGQGKRLIGIVKEADGIILMHDLSKPLKDVKGIAAELARAKVKKPFIIIGNKIDLKGSKDRLNSLIKLFSGYDVIGLSTLTGEGMEKLRDEIWKISELIRVYTGRSDEGPLILGKGSSVKDFVSKIHGSLIGKFKFAKVTGKSAKFSNQRVGLAHILEDEDVVELVLEN